MKVQSDQTQLFKMEYDTRCDTFGCNETGAYMVGRPDGPLNTSHVLCQTCTDSLVESVKELFDMHEKSVHAPLPFDLDVKVLTEIEILLEALDEVRTHAEMDNLISNYKIEGIPGRDEEGGKLHERREAIRKKMEA